MPDYLDVFRSRLRIAVVYGGDKNRENAVIYRTLNPRPWKSYEAVARDIQSALYELGFEYVTLLPDDMTLPQRLKEEQIHLAWLNTGGVQGYDPVSHTAAMLEMLGLPYVGHNPLNASTLDNKHIFKRELQALDIPTAPFMTWHPARGASGRYLRIMMAHSSSSRFQDERR
jgi:D-alanine-D-alanine ligase